MVAVGVVEMERLGLSVGFGSLADESHSGNTVIV